MKYSKSTGGFYDQSIHDVIPSDAVEITTEKWQSLIDAQAKGQMIKADKAGNPIAVDRPDPTGQELIDLCISAVQKNLDSVAKSWGYDSLLSAASYANSSNLQFKAESEALISWRDQCWTKAYELVGNAAPKSVEDFLSQLPKSPVKPSI